MKKQVKIIFYISVLLALIVISKNTIATEGINLPNISDPSSKYMSISQEKKLGKIIHAEVLGKLNVIHDPLINAYINNLGSRMVSHLNNNKMDYKFVIVKDRGINAFAAPGGIIVLNSGLIENAKNESEFASVVAHEIAHVNARHLSRMYAENSEFSFTKLISIVGTILTAIYDKDNIGNSFFIGKAAETQENINYIRKRESDADRIAVHILSRSGINPLSMASFLQNLTNKNDNEVVEYLKTHPIAANRINNVESLASQYKGEYAIDSFAYQILKSRVMHYYTPTYIKNENKNISKDNLFLFVIYAYSKALHLIEKQEYNKSLKLIDESIELLKSNHKLHNIELYFKLIKCETYYYMKEYEKAEEILESLVKIYPDDETIIFYLTETKYKLKKYDEVIEKLMPILIQDKKYNYLKVISKSAYKANKKSLGHEYKAELLQYIGNYIESIKFYELAKAHNMKGYMVDKRIDAKILKVKKILNEESF